MPRKGTAIVERVNFFKKHTKPNPQKNVQGGILERESPIQCANCRSSARAATSRPAPERTAPQKAATRFCRKCNTEM